jgi:hypothetical protein
MGVGKDDTFPNLKGGSWFSALEILEPAEFVAWNLVRVIEAFNKLALRRLSHVRQGSRAMSPVAYSMDMACPGLSVEASGTTE